MVILTFLGLDYIDALFITLYFVVLGIRITNFDAKFGIDSTIRTCLN